jgi:CHAD domain-containing protein
MMHSILGSRISDGAPELELPESALLSTVRDLDVMQEYLRQEVTATDPAERRAGRRLLRRLEAERTHARAEPMKALGDARRYFALLDRLERSIE